MSDPRWSDETEQLVAEALWAACFVPPRGAGTTIGQPTETCREDARGALTALADAGLLPTPGAEIEAQWRVWWRDIETSEAMVTSAISDRGEADRRLDDLSDVWGHHARLMARSVITTPWTEVETTKVPS